MEWQPDMEWSDYDGPRFGDKSFECVICCEKIVDHSVRELNYTSIPRDQALDLVSGQSSRFAISLAPSS